MRGTEVAELGELVEVVSVLIERVQQVQGGACAHSGEECHEGVLRHPLSGGFFNREAHAAYWRHEGSTDARSCARGYEIVFVSVPPKSLAIAIPTLG